MALELSADANLQTGFSLYSDVYQTYLLYPRGRHLRGALGWIAFRLGLDISKQFPEIGWDGVIFRDMLPLCNCKTIFKIDRQGKFIPCPVCGAKYDETVLRTVQTRKLTYKEVSEGKLYRLSIILQDDKWLKDILLILDYANKYGLYLGSRHTSGHGKFIIQDLKTKEIKPFSYSKAMLVSEAISEQGSMKMVIGRRLSEKDKAELIQLKALPIGTVITNVNGFYYGEYGGLGFGEFVPYEGH